VDPARREELLRDAIEVGTRVLVLAALGVLGVIAVDVARRGLRILWRHASHRPIP